MTYNPQPQPYNPQPQPYNKQPQPYNVLETKPIKISNGPVNNRDIDPNKCYVLQLKNSNNTLYFDLKNNKITSDINKSTRLSLFKSINFTPIMKLYSYLDIRTYFYTNLIAQYDASFIQDYYSSNFVLTNQDNNFSFQNYDILPDPYSGESATTDTVINPFLLTNINSNEFQIVTAIPLPFYNDYKTGGDDGDVNNYKACILDIDSKNNIIKTCKNASNYPQDYNTKYKIYLIEVENI